MGLDLVVFNSWTPLVLLLLLVCCGAFKRSRQRTADADDDEDYTLRTPPNAAPEAVVANFSGRNGSRASNSVTKPANSQNEYEWDFDTSPKALGASTSSGVKESIENKHAQSWYDYDRAVQKEKPLTINTRFSERYLRSQT